MARDDSKRQPDDVAYQDQKFHQGMGGMYKSNTSAGNGAESLERQVGVIRFKFAKSAWSCRLPGDLRGTLNRPCHASFFA